MSTLGVLDWGASKIKHDYGVVLVSLTPPKRNHEAFFLTGAISQQEPLWLGAGKTNLGHLEAGVGYAYEM